jgi:hypothetical protein
MTLGDAYPAILTIALIGILLGVVFVILGTLETNNSITALGASTVTNSPAWAINQTIAGLGNFVTWIGIIVLIIAASIVIGLVVNSFKTRAE